MSFLLFALAASAFAAGAGFIAARRVNRQVAADPPPAVDPLALPPSPQAAAENAMARALPFALGDVVTVEADRPLSLAKTEHADRWLEGALALFDGDALIAAVFVAPEVDQQAVVVAFPVPRRDIGWLSAIDADLGREPPTSIDLGGMVLARKRRLAVRLERLGRGAPTLGASGLFVEYEASGDMMAVIVCGELGTRAWLGRRYDQGSYERMGSGVAP